MGLTRFPHGILATPNLGSVGGADRLVTLWESDNIWYVDGDDGSDSNAGNEPGKSVALPSTAYGKASRSGTIYIKPRCTAASAQTYYYDNITVAYTKPGMSFIGAGYQCSRYGVQLRPSVATQNLFTINAPACTIQNMRLTFTGGTAGLYSIIQAGTTYGDQATELGSGLHLVGCLIENDKQVGQWNGGDGATAGAVSLNSAEYTIIEDCWFLNNHTSINMFSAQGDHRYTIVRRNIFGGAVANRDVDIMWGLNSSGCSSIVISDNIFADGDPAHSSAEHGLFIDDYYQNGATPIICNNWFADRQQNAFKAAGVAAHLGTNAFLVGNYHENYTAEALDAASDLVGRDD